MRTFLLAIVIFFAANAIATNEPRLINASGSSEIWVMPDMAEVNVAIEYQDMDLNKAKKQIDDAVFSAIKSLNAMGVLNDDIRAEQLSINRKEQYNPQSKKREFSGYILRRQMLIRLKDLSLYSDLLQLMVEQGINQVNPTQFKLKDRKAKENEAKRLAIADTQTEAKLLAKEFGVRLGKLYRASTQATPNHPVHYVASRAIKMDVETGSVTQPQYNIGQIKIEARADASYLIE